MNRPNYEPSIFLKSSRVAFCIHETLDLWEKCAERCVLHALYTVKIDKVTQCDVCYAAPNNFLAAVALKAQALRLSF